MQTRAPPVTQSSVLQALNSVNIALANLFCSSECNQGQQYATLFMYGWDHLSTPAIFIEAIGTLDVPRAT
eukprot:6073181-Pleurochrysis_carterae.AAC.1